MPDIIVMFFLLGLVAGTVKSDLSIPREAYDILSLLLMLTIGLKGGMALYGNLAPGLLLEMLAVAGLGFALPLLKIPILRYGVGPSIAGTASFAAHYGSVSAGTFAVALAWVETRGLSSGSQVTLYLVLLELPAIMVGLWFYRRFGKRTGDSKGTPLWQETLTNRSVILLVGGWANGGHPARARNRLYRHPRNAHRQCVLHRRTGGDSPRRSRCQYRPGYAGFPGRHLSIQCARRHRALLRHAQLGGAAIVSRMAPPTRVTPNHPN